MCTVTFIPKTKSNFVLTSNRDESPERSTIPPEKYKVGQVHLLFPKDELAGGTWIGVSHLKRMICLLNGGFESHKRASKYRMSRGVIVTDLLTKEDATAAINEYDFTDVEPFTIVWVDWANTLQLFELVWDGTQSYFEEKPLTPQIWSSSLLYTSEVKRKREQWFSNFLMKHTSPSEEELLNFHKLAGDGNPETDLIMNRGFVQTKSISQILKKDSDICFRYEDLQTQLITQNSL